MLSDKEIAGAVAADVAAMMKPEFFNVIRLKMMELPGEMPSNQQIENMLTTLMWMKHKLGTSK